MLDPLDTDAVMVSNIRTNEGGEGTYNNGIS